MKTLQDFNERFGTEKQCLAYLYRLRWPDGYRCPQCYHSEAWQIKEWKYKCRKCGYQSTVTAGTIFQDSHLPIALWFKAIWYVCSQTGGANALDLQKQLNLGSYRTAWTMLLKIRKLMADNEPSKLRGKVAVDACRIYKTHGAKHIDVFLAAEICTDGKIGNICMDIDYDYSRKNFCAFLHNHIKVGSTIISVYHFSKWDPILTDSVFLDYPISITEEYKFLKMHRTKDNERYLIPVAHSIMKWLDNRGLLNNQPVRSSREHLQSYLAESCYKFNRRNQTVTEMFEELLYRAVRTEPLTYNNIVTEKEVPGRA